MGVNSIRTFSIAFLLMAITLFYFSPETLEPVISVFPLIGIPEASVRNFLKRMHGEDVSEPEDPETKKLRLFTKEELAKYDGGPNSLGLCLAILGEVFDVSKGAQHYKPGSSYSGFSGRDASRAYLTGDFTDEKNADDVSGLDESSLSGLMDWLTFYRDEYPFMGKMTGRYYDENGKPTKQLEAVLEKIEKSKSNKWLEDHEKEIFPPCNSEWSKEKGSRVWCTNKSGGVQRDWVGVPRKYYKVNKDPRCVCVRDSGSPSAEPELVDHRDLGDLEHPNLKEYPNCPTKAASCKIDHP